MDIESNITENNDSIQSNIETTFAMPLGATVVNSDLSLSQYIADGGTFTVPDSIIKNSDDTFSVSVPAAQPYTLEDVEHIDTDGSPKILPAMTPMVCTPATCSGADVTNSDNTFNAHINDGDTLVLPDITATEPDGSTYTHPSVKDIVLPDNRNLNVQFLATYDDEITLTATADEATTWTTESLTNVSAIAYEKNSVAVSLPITLAASDTLKITITRINAALDSKVKLTNA